MMRRPWLYCLLLLAVACGNSSTRPHLPDSIVVSPATTSIAAGDTVQLTATVLDSYGAALPGYSVTWTSANSTVAVVDGATGLVTGKAAGTVEITAGISGLTGKSVIMVASRPILTIAKAGSGTGLVTSSPLGISCGASCSTTFAPGADVVLGAAPDAGSTFVGWSGACTGSATCHVKLLNDTTVTANFSVGQSVTVAISGPGTVQSTPPGINCSAGTCVQTFPIGTVVTLAAIPASSGNFVGWGGGTCTGGAGCTFTVSGPVSVTASFITVRTLSVHVSGQGNVSGSGVNCSVPTCSQTFPDGAALSLNATPADGWTFGGFSGPPGCTTGTCSLTLTSNQEVTATFLPTHTITVNFTGSGVGTVVSNPAGINCSAGSCSYRFVEGTIVSLGATPASGSVLAGWSGGCTGNGACNVTVLSDTTVNATFSPAQQLTVTVAGTGGGTVTSSPPGINCSGGVCRWMFPTGTPVVLTATADTHSIFSSYGQDCSGSSCSVTMNADHAVTATFSPGFNLSIALTGKGRGTVTSSPSGLTCGATSCSGKFSPNTAVILTAAAQTGSIFSAWGVDCSGTGADCTLTMDKDHAAAASFTPLRTLTVNLIGSGTVAPTSNAWSCAAATCKQTLLDGAGLTLLASPAASWVMQGWTGDCSSTGSCALSFDADKTVTATFQPQLTVSASAGGSVAGTLPCGSGAACTQDFAQGSTVTLSAVPLSGYVFAGWTGACSGMGACSFSLNSPATVAASFGALRKLTVMVFGSGTGSVVSSPPGIACNGGSCTGTFANGKIVTLTATPAGTSAFSGWTGPCGSGPGCAVTMSADANVTATFEATHQLTVSLAGAGGGTVQSDLQPGINCASGTCTARFVHGTSVGLYPNANSSSVFSNFSGDCSGNQFCQVSMFSDHSVGVTFLPAHTLHVTIQGSGSGSVSSNPAGISATSGSLNASSSALFTAGSTVVLTATVNSGSVFSGWQGVACPGSGPCSVVLDADVFVTASLTAGSAPVQPQLSVTVAGGGSVAGTLACASGTCTQRFPAGTAVSLSATPQPGFVFGGWSGACGGTASCNLSLASSASVTATFLAAPRRPPSAPGSLTALSVGGQVVLEWKPNPSTERVTGYRVYYAAQAGVSKTGYRGLQGGTMLSVPGPAAALSLAQSGRLSFVVTAVNAAGEGPESAELRAGAAASDDQSTLR